MTQPQSRPVAAAIWMIGSIVSFTAMAVAARAVSFEMDTFEIMMYRSLLGVIVVLSVATLAGTRQQITTRSLGTQIVRNLFHFTGQNLWLFAVTVVPLAQVFALEFTLPIWVMFLAAIVLGESLTRTRVMTAVIGFAGILIVTRPWSIGLSAGIVAAALAAIGFAASAVFTRLLTRTETITCIMFWLTGTQLVFGLICAGYDGDIAIPSAGSVPWLVVIGMAGLVAHFCLTTALSLAPAAVVVPIDFVRLPLIVAVGYFLYNEPLEPPVLLGAIIIFAATYYNIRVEARNSAA
ncbi:MAG: DMT family transporter [Marinosulfonomonas sp.]